MKVLVTGGAGFIGGFLTRSLVESGAQVDILDSFSRGVRDNFLTALAATASVRVMEADLLAPGALEGLDEDYDYIYHLAAIIGVQHVLKRPYAVLVDNVRMHDAVIGLARRQSRLQRMVFTSTSEIYAGTLKQGILPIPTPETAPLVVSDLAEPRTSYMLSKIYGEAMCRASGVPSTMVRPHNFYGPRMGLSHVIPELLQRAFRASDGESLEVFSIDHQRTFCFIEDAVAQIRAAVESPQGEGQVFNIGTESPEVTIGELAETILRVVGRKLAIVPKPATPGSPARRCPSTEKVDGVRGVRDRVGLEEGIRRTFQWYREHVFSGPGVSAR